MSIEYQRIEIKRLDLEVPKHGAFLVVLPNGSQFWFLDGNLHKEDGPAVIWNFGQMEWHRNGKYFREDGKPTWIKEDYCSVWHKDNSFEFHRIEGPAMIYEDGTKRYFLDCQELTEEQWLIKREPFLATKIKDMVV